MRKFIFINPDHTLYQLLWENDGDVVVLQDDKVQSIQIGQEVTMKLRLSANPTTWREHEDLLVTFIDLEDHLTEDQKKQLRSLGSFIELQSRE